MRPAALGAHNRLHVAIGVELDHRFRQIEVDGAATMALCIQLQRQLIHLLKIGYKFRKVLAHGPICVDRCIR